jgi:hypothetical protein
MHIYTLQGYCQYVLCHTSGHLTSLASCHISHIEILNLNSFILVSPSKNYRYLPSQSAMPIFIIRYFFTLFSFPFSFFSLNNIDCDPPPPHPRQGGGGYRGICICIETFGKVFRLRAARIPLCLFVGEINK